MRKILIIPNFVLWFFFFALFFLPYRVIRLIRGRDLSLLNAGNGFQKEK